MLSFFTNIDKIMIAIVVMNTMIPASLPVTGRGTLSCRGRDPWLVPPPEDLLEALRAERRQPQPCLCFRRTGVRAQKRPHSMQKDPKFVVPRPRTMGVPKTMVCRIPITYAYVVVWAPVIRHLHIVNSMVRISGCAQKWLSICGYVGISMGYSGDGVACYFELLDLDPCAILGKRAPESAPPTDVWHSIPGT